MSDFVTSWTATHQAFLSFTISPEFAQTHVHWIDDAIQLSHSSATPFSSCPQSFSASESFLMSQVFALGGQSTGASASASVLPVNIQGWFPLGLAVKGTRESLLQHHSSKASVFWCSAFFMIQLSHVYMTTGKTIALTRWTFVDLKVGQDKCWQISFVGRCWVLHYYFWTLVGSIRLIADESAHLHLTENLVSFLHLTCFLTLVRGMVKSGHARSSAIKDGKKILCWYSSGQGYSVSGN